MTKEQTERYIRYIQACIESFCNFIIVDAEGKIVYVNQQYSATLGRRTEDILGRDVREVIPNTRMLETLQTQEEEIGSIMTLFDHRLGHEVTVVCNRRPIWEDGKLIGAMAETTNRDLSEVKKLYKRINEMQAENRRYRAQIEILTTKKGPLDIIIGQAPAMMEVKNALLDHAPSDLPVLFTGETGTGKELFANALQQLSRRSHSSFVKINCAAIPKDLMESEFFGYEDGAFTGARKVGKPGKIELADHGTLLLDEVGELPMTMQAKLLRVLQENELERVGGTRSIPVDLRLICSTNRDLAQMVEDGTFRRDLYYRINTVELHIPPLRERMEDLPLLCTRFIHKIDQTYGLQISGISPDALAYLGGHRWPGNVRELERTIERAAILCKEGSIERRHLSFFRPVPMAEGRSPAGDAAPDVGSLHARRDQTEREAIVAALKKAGGNKSKAARLLHIDRSDLYAKIKKYHIELENG